MDGLPNLILSVLPIWDMDFSCSIQYTMNFKNSNDDYNFKAYIYPHLLFSYNINPQLRIMGELGLPSYKFTRDRATDYKDFKDQVYFYSKIGIEYIF